MSRALPALVIAQLTLRETVRRKLVIALLALTGLLMIGALYLVSQVPNFTSRPMSQVEIRTIVSQIEILIAYVFNFILALSAAFMASPAISGELETGTALAVLTRPISRAQYVLGKWLGLAALVAAYSVGSSLVEMIGIRLISDYWPPDAPLFLVMMVLSSWGLLTLALLLSTRLSGMTGGVIALGLFGVAWLGGIVTSVGEVFENETVANFGNLTKLLLPTDALWRGAIYALEPASFLAVTRISGPTGRIVQANPFFQQTSPAANYLAWVAIWFVAMLLLTIESFRRREV